MFHAIQKNHHGKLGACQQPATKAKALIAGVTLRFSAEMAEANYTLYFGGKANTVRLPPRLVYLARSL